MPVASGISSQTQPRLLQNTSQRILSLNFPHLPADRVARKKWGMSWLSRKRPDHPPLVFVDRIRNAMRITALDICGEKAGLKCGQGLAEARAMRPDIDILPADPAADKALLAALADWCDQYTPLCGDGWSRWALSGHHWLRSSAWQRKNTSDQYPVAALSHGH